ncbi:MAG: formylglycine-generating enzyme family protein, partial [Rubritalea sp.]
MVEIPAGSYIPLYTTDKTPRKVEAFRIDTLPVSKKQFLAFVTTNPKWQRSNVSPIFADKTYLQD